MRCYVTNLLHLHSIAWQDLNAVFVGSRLSHSAFASKAPDSRSGMENHDAAGRAVITWFREHDEERMIATFDRNLVVQFGVDAMKSFVDNGSKHKHSILHVLAKEGKVHVLKHLVQLYGFDMDVQRASDRCTLLHLAAWYSNRNVARALRQLGADPSIQNSYGEVPDDTAEIDKPIMVRVLGATSIEDILQVVAEELGQFNRLDGITAFTRLAT